MAVHGTWWSNYSVADLRETFPFHVTTLLQKDNHWSGESLSAALMLPSSFILHPSTSQELALRLYTEQEPAYTKQKCWAMSLSGHSSLQVVWRWLSIGAQGSEPLLGIGAGLFCVVIGPSAMNGFPKMTRDTNTPWALLISMGKAHDNLTL